MTNGLYRTPNHNRGPFIRYDDDDDDDDDHHIVA